MKHANRHVCSECGQSIVDRSDLLCRVELRGPRNIRASDIDRIFDDGGRRFLIIEEKHDGETVGVGQAGLLSALARRPGFTVWLVGGTPDSLEIWSVSGDSKRRLELSGNATTYQRADEAWFDKRPLADLVGEVRTEAWDPRGNPIPNPSPS